MELITKLPEQKPLIGTRQIIKNAKAGKVKRVIVAKNCPDFLLSQLRNLNVVIDQFDGDESQLATKLGKPFHVAMVGY